MNSSSTDFNWKSFLYAWRGLREASASQPNFRIHIAATIFVIAGGSYFRISGVEWALAFFAIGLVTAAECFNTALEYLTDLVSPQQNAMAGKVKDLSAAGVLICALIATTIGLIIFVPKIFN